jgi:hypothetical protein
MVNPPPMPSPAQLATMWRTQAADLCAEHQWKECQWDAFEASRLDPQGEIAETTALMNAASEGLNDEEERHRAKEDMTVHPK